MLKTFDISKSKEFQQIRQLIENSVIEEFGIDEIQDLCKLGQIEINSRKIDFRNNYSLMIELENLVKTVLLDNSIYQEFIQFPFNLRILLPMKSSSYRKLDFNVDTIHCDQWSGAPIDCSNVFLYICKPELAPELTFYEYEDSDAAIIKQYIGPYKSFSGAEFQEKLIKPSMPGTMHVFNDYQAHSVKRHGSGVTISLDFRTRPLSKNFINDLNALHAHQNWTTHKMTSLAVYWRWLRHSQSKTLEDKIRDELLDNNEEWFEAYKILRLAYIKKHYIASP